jgi:uncharacterized protein (TIGR02284 family)
MANDVTSVLNGLIETCKDGEEGFRHAAEKAKEPSLKSLFTKYATQRATYATELQALVTATGETPSDSGHIVASLHRGWITLKEALAKDEDKALIDEAEAGEDAAMKAYKQAVAANLPIAVNTVVQQQFSGVQEAHGIIRDLKHNWTGSVSSTTAAV